MQRYSSCLEKKRRKDVRPLLYQRERLIFSLARVVRLLFLFSNPKVAFMGGGIPLPFLFIKVHFEKGPDKSGGTIMGQNSYCPTEINLNEAVVVGYLYPRLCFSNSLTAESNSPSHSKRRAQHPIVRAIVPVY